MERNDKLSSVKDVMDGAHSISSLIRIRVTLVGSRQSFPDGHDHVLSIINTIQRTCPDLT